MLLLWYRRRFFNKQIIVALVILAAGGLIVGSAKTAQLQQIIDSRTSTTDRSSQAHVAFYGLIQPVLEQSPVFGIGINNFAVYYQFQTGRADFGPHSFYVATLIEMGIAGAIVWAAFLLWVGGRLFTLLRAGRARSQLDGDTTLSAVARGLAAGFVATLVGNIFYLTMIFSGFYVILLLILAAPAAFGIERVLARKAAAVSATPAT